MKTRLYLLLPALALTSFAFSQQTTYLPWEFAGGPPCPVRSTVLHQGTLYAGTDCGLYKRPESGGGWEKQADLPDSAVVNISANADVLVVVFGQIIRQGYSGHMILDIFNSSDNGASFTRRFSFPYNYWSYNSGPHATNHTDFARLYVLGDSSFVLTARSCDYGCRYTRLFSTNNGRQWAYFPFPNNGNYYFPSTLNPYATRGDTTAIFNFDSLRLLNSATLQPLSAVAVSPALQETAAGMTWVENRLAVAFQNGHYAYSDNLGFSWTIDSLPLTGINDFFYTDHYYYWCTDSGFYRSPALGPATLETLYTRPGPLGAVSKAWRKEGGWYLLARGVALQLADGAGDAEPISTTGITPATGTLSQLPGRLGFQNEEGLWWQSTDGNTWSVEEQPALYVLRLHNFYVSTTVSLAQGKSPDGYPGVYRSVDGGASWTLSLAANQSEFLLQNSLDNRVYNGRNYTADGGLSWQMVNAYAPTAALGDTLLAGFGQSVWKISFNHGQDWQDLSIPVPALLSYYSFHLADRTLYAFSKYSMPIYRSVNFGVDWESLGTSDPEGGQAYSERIGQTTWIHNREDLYFVSDPGLPFFQVAEPPFSEQTPYIDSDYPHPDFGHIVQKDSLLYAARNGGVWRTPACYVAHPFPTPPRDTAICQGNFVLYHGDTLRTAGTYLRKIPGQATFCDSLDVLRLQVHLIQKHWYKTICSGDSLVWNGVTYSGYGDFTQQFSTPTSCDSSVTLHLSNYYPQGWVNTPLCANDTLQLHGQVITTPGLYTFHLTSFAGCDSLLHVTVYDAQDTFQFSPVICIGATYSLFGHNFTETGDYWFTRQAPTNPCPSIYHILLTVVPDLAITVDTSVAIGSLLYGQVVYGDTTFTVIQPGAGSCDKIVTLVVHTIVATVDPDGQLAVRVFPNPFHDQLTWHWPGGEPARLRLYDARGQLCRTSWLSGPQAVWAIGDLPAGLYRAELLLSGQRYAWKVVKY